METKKRLYSLDLLRGTDIFFLTVICFIVGTFNQLVPLPQWFIEQFHHPKWVGFSVLDMVMPLFIFMSGASLPLALPKRLNADGRAGLTYWRHVAWRVAMLWVLGLVAQGQILTFDIHRISFFNNTLQTIACGYLIAAAVMLVKSLTVRLIIAFALVVVYGLFLHLCGDWTMTGNAAVVYEAKFLCLFYPDASWHPVKQIIDWHYTWWPTIPMFGFMALAGAFSTEVLKRQQSTPIGKCNLLAIAGAVLLALGGITATFEPVVKHIFTPSFTLLATGVSVLLYALYYFLFDILEWRRCTSLVTLFGRHSLMAYMFAETCMRGVIWKACEIFIGQNPKKTAEGLSRIMTWEQWDFTMNVCCSILLCVAIYYRDQWCKRKDK